MICDQCKNKEIKHRKGYFECLECGYTWADGSKTINPETKQILIKSDGKGFEIEVKGLSDIEILGLLTAFKNQIELRIMQQSTRP